MRQSPPLGYIKMSSTYGTKEEKLCVHALWMVIKEHEAFVARVERMKKQGTKYDAAMNTIKRGMVMYNLLKSLHDKGDAEELVKFIRIFLKTMRVELIFILTTGTLWIGLADSMENCENETDKEGDYLEMSDTLKFIYDLRKTVGISNPTD
jgi:hypothetical protein